MSARPRVRPVSTLRCPESAYTRNDENTAFYGEMTAPGREEGVLTRWTEHRQVLEGHFRPVQASAAVGSSATMARFPRRRAYPPLGYPC